MALFLSFFYYRFSGFFLLLGALGSLRALLF